jgi:virulence factor Mce-like protein
MKRILLSAATVIAAGAFLLLAGGASNGGNAAGTYKIEFDNAFGLVAGADFKVAGVRAGTIKSIDLCFSDHSARCQNQLHAVVTVDVTQSGFGQFHSDAFCQSRPQSLIGEYFVECEPGQSGSVVKPGATIPASRTQATIPADLLNNVMRMPYRERFSLIINELGAAVAARSEDLGTALRRAVPALTETDNLLNLLANDSKTLQALTANSNSVITALADNKAQVQRFITEANNAATDTASQQSAFQATWHKLPGFLEQLQPTMQKLGAAADTNTPVLANLRGAAAQLDRFFVDLPPFSRSSLPALKSLGKASVTGKQAAQAARPTVADLNKFAKPNPELAQNLAIVLQDLDNRSRAVEADSRSPGGKGYTGLEALLQYVFNQTLAINGFSQYGHYLTVDAFVDPMCSQYATPQSVAKGLAQYGPAYRQCYSWLGPNQPGINETDPSNPTACVPDPGGAPPGQTGPQTTACKLSPSAASDKSSKSTRTRSTKGKGTTAGRSQPGVSGAGRSSPLPGTHAGPAQSQALGLQSTLGRIESVFGGGGSPAISPSPAPAGSSSSKQTTQLLNYLLAP